MCDASAIICGSCEVEIDDAECFFTSYCKDFNDGGPCKIYKNMEPMKRMDPERCDKCNPWSSK